jgi:hypothetical protein
MLGSSSPFSSGTLRTWRSGRKARGVPRLARSARYADLRSDGSDLRLKLSGGENLDSNPVGADEVPNEPSATTATVKHIVVAWVRQQRAPWVEDTLDMRSGAAEWPFT